jgi:hypothetical protein
MNERLKIVSSGNPCMVLTILVSTFLYRRLLDCSLVGLKNVVYILFVAIIQDGSNLYFFSCDVFD